MLSKSRRGAASLEGAFVATAEAEASQESEGDLGAESAQAAAGRRETASPKAHATLTSR